MDESEEDYLDDEEDEFADCKGINLSSGAPAGHGHGRKKKFIKQGLQSLRNTDKKKTGKQSESAVRDEYYYNVDMIAKPDNSMDEWYAKEDFYKKHKPE